MCKEEKSKIITVEMPLIRTMSMNNCKIMHALIHNARALAVGQDIMTIPGKNIAVCVMLDSDEGQLIDLGITPFDQAVMDAVYTLYTHDQPYYTPEMIVRVMYADKDIDVTKKKKAMVEASIDKLSRITLTMDCTEEMQFRKKIGPEDTWIRQGALLPVRKTKVRSANNQAELEGYYMYQVPILYEYAGTIKQIINYPTDLMRNRSSRSSTLDWLLIKRYAIMRIELMKNKRNNVYSKDIIYLWSGKSGKMIDEVYKGMLRDLGYYIPDQPLTRSRRNKIHHNMMSVLGELKAYGCIKGFSIKTGSQNRIEGIRIIL